MPGPADRPRLASALARWGLENRGELAGGFSAAVFACVSITGDELVLKLPPTPEEALAEAAALRSWAGSGVAVPLLDYSAPDFALLLPRIKPATPLPPGDDETAIRVVAEILRELHRPRPVAFPFVTLMCDYLAWERRALRDVAYERQTRHEPQRGEEGLARLEAARRTAMYLSSTATSNTLLHGDVVDKNLLWNGACYLAVDPIPRVGDPCSDVGFFAAGHHPVGGGILDRSSAIAARLGLNEQRARQWAAVWAVHQTCQAWRDDQPDLDAFTGSPEVDALLTPWAG
jgi:streptomycin 6-kinase